MRRTVAVLAALCLLSGLGAASDSGTARAARDLGPTDPAIRLQLTLSLAGRDPARLEALLESGRTMSSGEFDRRFAPDPGAVAPALAVLEGAGLHPAWEPGAGVASAEGSVAAVEHFLGLQLRDYEDLDGRRYFAPDSPLRIPPSLGPVVVGVSGLDSRPRYRAHASRPGGLVPLDVRRFYDIQPLLDQGFDGSGETVVIPAIDDLPNHDDLDRYASLYRLPPFNVTVRRDSSWGQPDGRGRPGSEVTLDVEVVHAVAPGARIIVYTGSPEVSRGALLFDQMVKENANAIISDSIGACEPETPRQLLDQGLASNNRAVAQGMSHFVASGDSGAYDCGQDRPPAVDFMSGLPNVTSVGGTTAFLSPDSAYEREAAWGSAIARAGSGGGLSGYFKRPSYQKGPGVDNRQSNGYRQVPDVAAIADVNTGWHIVAAGRDRQVGGTSAAAPLWAGVTALINQYLRRQGLPRVGFANPGLYWIGQNPSRLPAPPFHDIAQGNNLLYAAGPGWDYATGWGSMHAANLAQAFAVYQRSQAR